MILLYSSDSPLKLQRYVLIVPMRLFTVIAYILISGCSHPGQRFDMAAVDLGFNISEIKGDPFTHRIFRNRPATQSIDSPKLHVYLDGDGTPWINHRIIANDPTPRNYMVLEMMKLDPVQAIYLGRPCYHGFNRNPVCTPKFWTSHRYSEAVVASMESALRRWIVKYAYTNLTLIGYSGGGTLAMLLAGRIPVNTVVTLAANLDVAQWSRLHGYSPLRGSLNPAQQPLLDQRTKQLHIAGEDDKNVPPSIIKTVADNQASADFRVLYAHDHHCCWLESWPVILEMIPEMESPVPD